MIHTTKLTNIEFKGNPFLKRSIAGYIDDSFASDSFIIYEDGRIAFDSYYSQSEYKRLIRVIRKAHALGIVLGLKKFRVVNVKNTLRIITDIHGSTI